MQIGKFLKNFKKSVAKFNEDVKASGRVMAGGVIGLVVDVYVIAYTMPNALTALTNGSAWATTGSAVIALGTVVLPIVVIAVIVLGMLKGAGVTD
jgi:hypothetical protein